MFRTQGGQALPLGLALVLVGVLLSLVLFNTGQTASDKTRLANTADSAAYSGLLWQARALNFQAYANRAMVANQVSIAQAVSLQSWVSYGRITSENASAVLSGVPMINVLTQGVSQAFGAADSVVGPVATAAVPVVDWVNSVLAQSQKAMYLGSFAATPQIVEKIVAVNDEGFRVDSAYNIGGMLANLKDWKAFTEEHDTSDREVAQGRVDMINQSLDSFSRKRDWKFFSRYFPITPLTRMRVHRRGTTRLVEKLGENGAEWEWKAKDSVSLAIKIWRPLRSSKRVEIPIGWGEAYANLASEQSIESCSDNPISYSQNCDRWLRENRTAEYFADTNVHSAAGTPSRTRINANYQGIQNFRSLAESVLLEQQPTVELKVEVSLPVDAIRSADKLVAGNRWDVPILAPGNRLSSVSVAELFYERPDASEVPFVEKANGYNPYWSVRLKPVSGVDRMVALSLRSGSDSSSVPNQINARLIPYSDEDSKPNQRNVNSRELGPYSDALAEAIADALGVDSDALIDPMTAIGEVTDEELQEFIDEHLGDELSELQTLVAEELKTIITEAVRRILVAALGQAVGVDSLEKAGEDLSGEVNSMLDRLDTNIDRIVDDVDAIVANAEAMIDEFEAEMERIQEEVGRLFALALEEITHNFNAELAEAQQKLMELQAEKDAIHDSGYVVPISLIDEISALHERLEALVTAELERRLALALMDIVDRATDMFDLPYSAALAAVRAVLISESEDINPLQLTEVDEDEGDDW
ncbi:MAG: hypothetical protein KTR35_16815 [Gammaproteobacteria bacterium]|nr:hypothetical protein [Gammaproteobacteria bacterium]